MKEKIAPLIVFLVLSIVIQGCSGSPETADNTLILSLEADPTTLDPALGTDVASGMLDTLLFSTLVRFDESLVLRGDVAESWKLSADKRTYTFVLKDDVCFSNGRKLTAQDVKYSFERVLAPETRSPRAWLFRDITNISVLDDYSLTITLKKAFSPFLSFLTMPAAAIVPEEEVMKWGLDFSEHPVGSGPWKLSGWKRDYKVTLKKNPYYFDKKPAFDTLVFKILKEPLTISTEFELKHLDMMEPSAADILQYLDDPSLHKYLLSRPGLNIYYLGLNCRKTPLKNQKVRRAVVHAIDAVSILQTVRRGRGTLARGPVPPGLEGHYRNLMTPEYNPFISKQLLEEAGYPDGIKLTLLQSRSETNLEVTEVFQAQLAQAGINIRIVQQEWSAFKANLIEGNFDMFYVSWWADYPDGENFLFPLFHSSNHGSGGNYTGYSNPAVDKLIEEIQTIPSGKKRAESMYTVQKILNKEMPIVCLWNKTSNLIVQPEVKKMRVPALYTGQRFTTVYKEDTRK